MEPAVQVENLVKRFGSFTAVDGVSFSVERGEIFGILGPNGAGKTTTLEIIESLHKPTEGQASVLGLDVQSNAVEVKARIGVQLQASAYYNYLNLKEILALLGSFYPRKASPESLLDQVGLADKITNRISELSGGQQQRFAVAASLVNNPEVVILDEPTTGLDPQARRNLWSLIRGVNQRGLTVLLTTHYMEEAEAICDRLANYGPWEITGAGYSTELNQRARSQLHREINHGKTDDRVSIKIIERRGRSGPLRRTIGRRQGR